MDEAVWRKHLQEYQVRKAAGEAAGKADDDGSSSDSSGDDEEEDGAGGVGEAIKAIGCSAGSKCARPGEVMTMLCGAHKNPCHFECADIPCKDSCGEEDGEGEQEGADEGNERQGIDWGYGFAIAVVVFSEKQQQLAHRYDTYGVHSMQTQKHTAHMMCL